MKERGTGENRVNVSLLQFKHIYSKESNCNPGLLKRLYRGALCHIWYLENYNGSSLKCGVGMLLKMMMRDRYI